MLHVKFDTVDRSRYETITGIEGSFSRFLDGVRILADSGQQYYFQAALTPHHTDRLEEMVEFAIKHRAMKMRFVTIMPTARGRFAEWQFSQVEAGNLMETLAHIKEKYGNIVNYRGVGMSFNSYRLPNADDHPITDCKATRCYMRLTYSRNFVPCNCVRKVSIGSFGVGQLQKVWEGSEIRSLRASSFSCPVRIPKIAPQSGLSTM